MLVSLIVVAVVLAAWSLAARRLDQWRVTAPMMLVLAGMVVGLTIPANLAFTLNTRWVEAVAEIILAVLLFVDATDVRGGFLGRDPKSAARVLFIGLPVSLGLAIVLGLWLLPGLSWAALIVVACVVVPTDFAPASGLLRDERVPDRVRNLLNVEAGYNDGICSPIFVFALALAGDRSNATSPLAALEAAVPQAVKAVVVGLLVGMVLAWLTNQAERRDLMTPRSCRVMLVVIPVLTYALSISISGNGFIAAFVCGITLHYMRREPALRAELELVDDLSFLLTAAMWFALGAATVLALSFGVPLPVLVFCLLALTVVRMLPVALVLIGTRFSWDERLLVGWLGPRGTTSIVFGLLAFNVLAGGPDEVVLMVMVVTVVGSVVLHGVGGPAAAHAYASRRAGVTPN
ncbi:cation:proton antiporter [Mycolicibacterium palauense]|uniref:cation:proton antiporter n=1 Tax=Mycolicibacterium palauense TaxID=2034511 RepID=UPI000BFEE084|nr:cation:proton antiporter [Mycolicibacterium palauense]